MDIILYNIIACLASLIFGYFFGSIPVGVILCRLFRGEDPRESGSQNSGGPNVGRLYGKKLGAATIILDAHIGNESRPLLKSLIKDEGDHYTFGPMIY